MSDLQVELAIADVLEKLQRTELSRDAVFLLVARLLEIQHPEKKVVFTDHDAVELIELDGSKAQIFLHNLWRECEQSPMERAEIVQRYLRVLAPRAGDESKRSVTRENIVALVRDSAYRDDVKKDDLAVTEHMVGDLWIIYAADFPDSTLVLSRKGIDDLGVTAQDLRILACANVDRILGKIEVESYGEWFSLTSENTDYLSSSLLLDYVWDFVATMVKGDLVVAIPARDTVIFSGVQDTDGLLQVRKAANGVFTNGNHTISPSLLRRVDGKWIVFS